MNNSNELVGGAKRLPSPFNIGLYLFTFLSPIFFLGNWNLNQISGVFFVFGTFALLGLSFLSERKRNKNYPVLGWIILWSLLSLFVHSFSNRSDTEPFIRFINFSLACEGFIFVLCGCLLFWLVANFADKFNLFFPLLFVNLLNLIMVACQELGLNLIWHTQTPSGFMGSIYQLEVFTALSIPIMCQYRWLEKGKPWIPFVLVPITTLALIVHTPVLKWSWSALIAIVLTLLLYTHKNRQKERFWVLLTTSFIGFICFKPLILDKLASRLAVWKVAFTQLIHNPLGRGFDNTLANNKVLYLKNWYDINNDFLNIARDLGFPFLLLILFGLWTIFKKSKIDYLWCSLVIILVSCFIQTSFYLPRIAGIGLILLALKDTK